MHAVAFTLIMKQHYQKPQQQQQQQLLLRFLHTFIRYCRYPNGKKVLMLQYPFVYNVRYVYTDSS